MATDLTIRLIHQPGTLADASDVLGRAGVNIEGACGYLTADHGVYHVLVRDPELARHSLISSGFEIMDERRVVVVEVENRPGAGAALFRRIAEAGVNIDLLYTTLDGRVVLGGEDPAAIQRTLG